MKMSLMKSCFFEIIRNWINFRLRSFLYQGTLWQKIQAAVSYKLVSYMQVLTVLFNLALARFLYYFMPISFPGRYFVLQPYKVCHQENIYSKVK